jgi:hypothetical protein
LLAAFKIMEYTFVAPEKIDEENRLIKYKTHAFVKSENGRNYQLCKKSRFISNEDARPAYFSELPNDGNKNLCKRCEKLLLSCS